MPFAGNYTDDDFFAPLNQPVTVVRGGNTIYNAQTGNGISRAANVFANTPSGYYTDKYRCNLTPAAMPGTWKTPLVWESYCQLGVNREITLLELIATASMDAPYRNALCNSLKDKGGNSRLPRVCGGNDPDIFLYNPTNIGVEEAQGEFDVFEAEANAEVDAIVFAQRKKIIAVTLIIVVVIVLLFLLFKK